MESTVARCGTVLLGLFACLVSNATVGAPDARGYTFIDSSEALGPAFDIEDIIATGTPIVLGDDQTSTALALGFDFRFYGQTYTEVHVCSNGFLTFQGGQSSPHVAQMLPTPTAPFATVAAFWTDLNPLDGGTIHYQTLGEEPYRRFVVQFTGVPHFNNPTTATFQAKLFETNDHIEVHYASAPATGLNRSIGTNNQDGTIGLSYQFNPDALDTPLAVRFRPPGFTDSNDPLGPAFDFEDLTAVGTVVNLEEMLHFVGSLECHNGPYPCVEWQHTPYLPIGFEFDYFGVPTHDVRAISSGLLIMADLPILGDFWDTLVVCDGWDPLCEVLDIPTNDANAFIAGFWSRVDVSVEFGSNSYGFPEGSVRYATLGEAPNRRFVLQVHSVSQPAQSTHQYKLFERDHSIEVHYLNAFYGSNARIGLQNHNSTTGIRYKDGFSTPATPLAIRYLPFGPKQGQEGDQILTGATTVESVEVISETEVMITFSAPISAISRFDVYISGPGAGTLPRIPQTVSPLAGNSYLMTWAGSGQARMLQGGNLIVRCDQDVLDSMGFPLASPAGGTHIGGGLASAPIPLISSSTTDPTSEFPVPISITFDYPVQGLSASDMLLDNASMHTLQSLCGASESCSSYVAELIPLSVGNLSVSIMAGAAADSAGNLSAASNTLAREFSGVLPPAPNDHYADAEVISGSSGAVTAWNVSATAESGEPDHAGLSMGQSVWWRWQAPLSGRIEWYATSASFTPVLAAYEGGQLTSLESIGDYLDPFPGRLEFNALAGEIYHIAVDSADALSGFVSLTWSMAAYGGDIPNAIPVDDDANEDGLPDLYEIMGFGSTMTSTNDLAYAQESANFHVPSPTGCSTGDPYTMQFVHQENPSETLLIGLYQTQNGQPYGNPSEQGYGQNGGFEHLFTGPSDIGDFAYASNGGGVYVHRLSTGETLFSDPAHNADGEIRMIAYPSGERKECDWQFQQDQLDFLYYYVAVSFADTPENSSFTDVVLKVARLKVRSEFEFDGLVYLADAGPDIAGKFVGETVVINGSADGGGVISWSFDSTPLGSQSSISGTSSFATFVPDRPGIYVCRLTAYDLAGNPAANDTMKVSVTNRPPVALVSAPNEVVLGQPVQVDGSASFDPDNQPIEFVWSFLEQPTDSATALVQPFYARPVFVPDAVGVYSISMTVRDDLLLESSQTVHILAVSSSEPEDPPPSGVPASTPHILLVLALIIGSSGAGVILLLYRQMASDAPVHEPN